MSFADDDSRPMRVGGALQRDEEYIHMPRVHVTGGYLNVEGFSGEFPDNSLPGAPAYPDIGGPGAQPGIDNSLPEPPPGIWPPPSGSRPIVPIGPDNTLPVAPGTIWPSPGRPARPDNSLPGVPPHPGGGPMPGNPPRPDAGLPGGQGGTIDNALPSRTFWMIAYCPSLGWRYIAVDPSLRPGMPLPPAPAPKG
jgi:hypothetical protein